MVYTRRGLVETLVVPGGFCRGPASTIHVANSIALSQRTKHAEAGKHPSCPQPPKERGRAEMMRDYKIHLLTPMFGGGVEGGCPDPHFAIRPTAIRGQLQFWWRATRGAGCPSYKELFNEHAQVWGTTDIASPVEVEVRDLCADQPKPCADYWLDPTGRFNKRTKKREPAYKLSWDSLFRVNPVARDDSLAYALFPFQGQPPKDNDPRSEPVKRPADFIEKASFTLRVWFPTEFQVDVEMAVWAWVNFGGLGARTRRGCGALHCAECAPKSGTEVETWFKANGGPMTATMQEWPTLPNVLLYRPKTETPLLIWDWVMGFMKYFRQGPDFARNSGPGRSRYPEPETIREITSLGADRARSGHPRLAYIPADSFPRAEFGLPIVFHFQGQGEPEQTVLYPDAGPDGKARDRMASPLIVKPLALANGKAIAAILRLVTPELNGVELRLGAAPVSLPSTTVLRDPRLASYASPGGTWVSPLAGSATGSALDAFLKRAREPQNGFQEARR
jgi:CRISPR-associated protein Cmr1